jgi:hypothetical protein
MKDLITDGLLYIIPALQLFVGTKDIQLTNFSYANFSTTLLHTAVKPGYKGIDLYNTSPVASDILRYQLIPHC